MRNNKEWIEQTLGHRQSESVPYKFMFSPPAQAEAEKHYGTDIEEALDIPLRLTATKSIKPFFADPKIYGPTIKDEFGVVWATNLLNRGAPVGPPLREPTLKGYRFPEATLDYYYEDFEQWCSRNKKHYRMICAGDLWERATFMRGMEDLLLDVALNGKFVEELLNGLTDYILQTMEILFSRFEFEGIAIADDYGTQKAMIISPEDWRKFIKPCLAKIYGKAKANGYTIFHHSCGHVTPIVGDLIDLGLDILHPIQPEAMDIFYLKKEFGKHITFCGGISTQDLLVNAAPERIRQQVRHLKKEMGRDGGYILEPGLTIEPDVPFENIVALIDEIRKPGY